jgi:hypothetical protein
MAEFSEDQRIVIRTLAGDEAAKKLRDSPELTARIDDSIAKRLPKLQKVERLLASWYGLLAIVLAVPFASAGIVSAFLAMVDKPLKTQVLSEISKEDGPIKSTLRKFDLFSGNLAKQFARSVDSATTKLLRFGCNVPQSKSIVDGFPACSPPKRDDKASLQARNVQEVNDQTLIFKADTNTQRVLLQIRLYPVDGREQLDRIGLRLQMPPLFSTGNATESLKLSKADLPDTHDFVHTGSGLLRLYGSVSDRSDSEPLHVDLELTKHLRKGGDIHALRFLAESLPGIASSNSPGSERFFLHAIVIVTHNLQRE